MGFRTLEVTKFLHGTRRIRIVGSGNGQGDTDFVGVETRITATQIVNFQTLDRLNHFRLDKFSILINTCRSLDSINQSSCSWTKEF